MNPGLGVAISEYVASQAELSTLNASSEAMSSLSASSARARSRRASSYSSVTSPPSRKERETAYIRPINASNVIAMIVIVLERTVNRPASKQLIG
jgi:hypothetical protein